jgi:hypothetical protein
MPTTLNLTIEGQPVVWTGREFQVVVGRKTHTAVSVSDLRSEVSEAAEEATYRKRTAKMYATKPVPVTLYNVRTGTISDAEYRGTHKKTSQILATLADGSKVSLPPGATMLRRLTGEERADLRTLDAAVKDARRVLDGAGRTPTRVVGRLRGSDEPVVTAVGAASAIVFSSHPVAVDPDTGLLHAGEAQADWIDGLTTAYADRYHPDRGLAGVDLPYAYPHDGIYDPATSKDFLIGVTAAEYKALADAHDAAQAALRAFLDAHRF